jgi:hypothetical protein
VRIGPKGRTESNRTRRSGSGNVTVRVDAGAVREPGVTQLGQPENAGSFGFDFFPAFLPLFCSPLPSVAVADRWASS